MNSPAFARPGTPHSSSSRESKCSQVGKGLPSVDSARYVEGGLDDQVEAESDTVGGGLMVG